MKMYCLMREDALMSVVGRGNDPLLKGNLPSGKRVR